MRVDVHAHHFPEEYIACLERFGNAGARGAVRRAAPASTMPLPERIALLDSVGIDLQVLSVAAAMPYLADAGQATQAARLGNDLYAAICREYAGRFAAFACLPLPHVAAAVTEAARCLDELGMLGVTVGCSVAGRQLDDPAFEPLWAELDRRAAVLFLHPMGTGVGPSTQEYGLRWMLGAPVEDAIAALRLILSGITTRYPRLRIVVPHLGGVLGFLVQRLDDEADREAPEGVQARVDGPPSAHLRRLWFDTVNLQPSALRCACDALGADRILLGTDFPYLAGPRFAACVNYTAEAGLPAGDVAAIQGENARTLLKLPA
jgi:aminocarboxymuconate-semialdehyde decarboxylase